MSAKTKIIVIRKNQLAFALVILIIVLLLAGLLISAIVTQAGNHPKAESDTSVSTAADSSAANSPAAASSEAASAAGSSGTSAVSSSEASAANSSEASATNSSGASAASAAVSSYTPGVYTSTVILNDTAMDVQVIVDADHINSISLVNLDEAVETSYPLVQPAIEELAEQIISSQSLENVTYSESNQYTSMVLYAAICDALDKAEAA